MVNQTIQVESSEMRMGSRMGIQENYTPLYMGRKGMWYRRKKKCQKIFSLKTKRNKTKRNQTKHQRQKKRGLVQPGKGQTVVYLKRPSCGQKSRRSVGNRPTKAVSCRELALRNTIGRTALPMRRKGHAAALAYPEKVGLLW